MADKERGGEAMGRPFTQKKREQEMHRKDFHRGNKKWRKKARRNGKLRKEGDGDYLLRNAGKREGGKGKQDFMQWRGKRWQW